MMGIRKIIVPIIVAGLVLFTYWDLSKTFFQQDEWWAFGIFNRRESAGGLVHFLLDVALTSGKIHFNPLTELGFYLQYKIFDMNFSGYAFVSIVTHLVNVSLVYIFVKKVLKNNLLAILSAILFAINSISHQAVTWVAASLNTQGSTMFSLIFLIFFIKYLEKESKEKFFLFISYAFIVLSLLFKEIIAPFLLAPFLVIYYFKDLKNKVKILKKLLGTLTVFLAGYILLRLIIFFIASDVSGQSDTVFATTPLEYLYRILVLPFRVIAQSIIPARYLLFLSRSLVTLAYPNFAPGGAVDPYIAETIGFDLAAFIISFIIISFSYISYNIFSQKYKDLQKGIILSLVVIVTSILPIVFISGKAGFVSIIEPRHFYPGSFGSSMLIVLFFFALFLKFGKKIIIGSILFFIFSLIALFHIHLIRSDIYLLKSMADIRVRLLKTVKNENPYLSEKALFLVESDTPYYGLLEKNVPVQISFGRMILLWHQKSENFPGCLYDDTIFLDLRDQGYRYCEGRGFGYFRDYDKLIEAVLNNNIPSENVIAYSWKGKTEEFKNITQQVKIKLKEELIYGNKK